MATKFDCFIFIIHLSIIMKFLELPKNVQEKIFESLHVRDRARLNIVLPQNQKLNSTTNTNYHKDRKLGVLVKSLKTQKVRNISPEIMCFLKSVQRKDPTTNDIIELFPEVENVFAQENNKPDTELLTYKIQKKMHVDKNDIDTIHSYDNYDVIDAIKVTSPEVFHMLFMHPKGKEFLENNILINDNISGYSIGLFVFSILLHGNVDLLRHILDNLKTYGVEIENIKTFLYSNIITLGSFYKSRKILFEFFDVPEDSQDRLYCHLIEKMDIDAALEVERLSMVKK